MQQCVESDSDSRMAVVLLVASSVSVIASQEHVRVQIGMYNVLDVELHVCGYGHARIHVHNYLGCYKCVL